ncbi:MAG: sensor protein RstB [Deltaproteobacteria bacterium ADurb.Bin207]|nr:MAG: sensor protein RstB [Deltaproteobacteria bacterium ADurb.Bin207]
MSHIDKVMEPFVQADGSPTRKHQGVGVGLAIARKIARGLGGELLVESPTHERIGGMVFRGTSCKLSVAQRAPQPS